jgi:hypothetical protein
VPPSLFSAQKKAIGRHRAPLRDQRKQQLHTTVSKLLAHLGLPSIYEGHAAGMALDFIHLLEQTRRKDLDHKMTALASTTFDEALVTAAQTEKEFCVDCRHAGIELKRRALCKCYQCNDCSTAEWYEETMKVDVEQKTRPQPFVHKCRAPALSEMGFNTRKRRRIARNETRTLVNAFTSIAAACIYLCARLQKRRFRWREITSAVEAVFGRKMRQDTVTRWVARISTAMGMEKSSTYETVVGFANHYLDKLKPTTESEHTFTTHLVRAVMLRAEPCSANATPSLRAVVGRVYNTVLDGCMEKESGKPVHLHNQQPWVLAAVCVYLVLQVERAGERRPTIAKLCELLRVDQSSFQKCKRNIAKFI